MSAAHSADQIRPLRRRDVEIVQRQSALRTHWVVKDPLQLNYFFFDHFQHWLFQKLDGSTTVAEIESRFNDAFSPVRISATQILSFCARLSHDGLLCENATGQLIKQRRAKKWKSRMWRLPISFLAFRLPGFDAHILIGAARFLMGWIFSWPALWLFMMWILFSFAFAIQAADQLIAELPGLAQLRAIDIISLLLAISVVKILHELGHAVCCQKMGAQCNEIGLMFLVFSPCLYCNVSDAWMLKSKWRRIAISAAGIYIELIIASLALFLWYYCQSEFLRSLFLNILIVCSLNTLLLNGNPLMRYDGYYILSDLMDVPNLSQQSQQSAWNWICQLFFKPLRKENDWTGTNLRVFQIAYYFASLAYRVLILTALFWVFYSVLKPLGLSVLAVVAAAAIVASTMLGFVIAFGGVVRRKNRVEPKRWFGILTGLFVAAGTIYFVANIKIPYTVWADAVIQLEDFHYCSAKSPGTLKWAIGTGLPVRQGDVVARLEDTRLDRQLLELRGQIQAEQLHIRNLITQSAFDNEARYFLPAAEARLADLNQRMLNMQQQAADLTIISPADGVIVSPPAKKDMQPESNLALATWDGTLLDERNLGCEVAAGELVCLVAAPDTWTVFLLIDERKLDLLSVNSRVKIQSALEIGQTYFGTVEEISLAETVDPAGGALAARTPTVGVSNMTYRAQIRLDRPLEMGLHGAKAQARIELDKETVAQIVRRYLIETFSLKL